MWNTSSGDRVLDGAEAALFRKLLRVAVKSAELDGSIALRWEAGVKHVDELPWDQQLQLLAEIGEALLRTEVPSPPRNTETEAIIAVLFAGIIEEIGLEIDETYCDKSVFGDGAVVHDEWRRSVLATVRQTGEAPGCEATVVGTLPGPECEDMQQWQCLIQSLHTRVFGGTLEDIGPLLDAGEHGGNQVTKSIEDAPASSVTDTFAAIPPGPDEEGISCKPDEGRSGRPNESGESKNLVQKRKR